MCECDRVRACVRVCDCLLWQSTTTIQPPSSAKDTDPVITAATKGESGMDGGSGGGVGSEKGETADEGEGEKGGANEGAGEGEGQEAGTEEKEEGGGGELDRKAEAGEEQEGRGRKRERDGEGEESTGEKTTTENGAGGSTVAEDGGMGVKPAEAAAEDGTSQAADKGGQDDAKSTDPEQTPEPSSIKQSSLRSAPPDLPSVTIDGGDSLQAPGLAPRGVFKGHTDTVEDVQFHPTHAARFCSVGDDRQLLFWDERAGGERGPVGRVERAHDADVHCVDWCPGNDNLVVTGSADKTVKLFDVRKLGGGAVGAGGKGEGAEEGEKGKGGKARTVHAFKGGHFAPVMCVQVSCQ